MKPYTLFTLLIAWLAITACSGHPVSYTVTGSVSNPELNGETVYIMRFDNSQYIDSTIITDGKFTFTGKADTALLCRIDARQDFSVLILENGNIAVDMQKHITPTGTPMNEVLTQFYLIEDSLYQVNNRRSEEIEKTFPNHIDSLQKVYYEQEWKPAYMAQMNSQLDKNKDNIVGVVILMSMSNYSSPDEMGKAFAKAGKQVLSNSITSKLIERNNQLQKTAVGMPFTDFTAETEDGSKVSLSDYVGKGKYTLVDFWASWCGPCREETPVLAEVYQQYKDKGLQVLGVAVLDKPEDSKTAISDLGITWPQMINAQATPMELYGINGIPHIILFGPDGTIVARNLRGDELKEKVKEVMQ